MRRDLNRDRPEAGSLSEAPTANVSVDWPPAHLVTQMLVGHRHRRVVDLLYR